MVLPAIERHGPIEAWIIDATGFPKKGQHSVGVARQYCGQLGKQDNCHVAVSLSLSNHHASLPVAWRLDSLTERVGDRPRRRRTDRRRIFSPEKPATSFDLIASSSGAGPAGARRRRPPRSNVNQFSAARNWSRRQSNNRPPRSLAARHGDANLSLECGYVL